MAEDIRNQGCRHLDDPNWNKWGCGDCGDYCTRCGCVGPIGLAYAAMLNEEDIPNLICRPKNDAVVLERMIKLMLHYIYNNDFPYEICNTQHERYGAEYDDFCERWGDDCCPKCAYDYFAWKAKQEIEKERNEGG